MRKPKSFVQMFTFDIDKENKATAKKAKVTKLCNMLRTGKPVFCTVARIRVQVSYVLGVDRVVLATDDGYFPSYDINHLTLFRHTR